MIRRLGSMMLWSLKKGAGNNMTNSFLDASVTSTRSVLHSQLLLKRNLNTNKVYPNIEVNTLDVFRQQATPEELQMFEQVKLEYETYLREGMDQRLLGGKESILLTEKSYLDLYPREKLVYLSPDSPRYYNPFGQDSDKIPIIGGIVDLETSGKQTFTRAKTEKIPTRRLPLDLHDKKYYGSKALPLIQIFDYVMALRQTGSLDIAKEAIAQRKFKQPEPGSKRQKNREY